MLANVLMAIALFCQTNPSNSAGYYDDVKRSNKICQRKLTTCVTDGEQSDYARKLANCIEKGDY